MTIYSLPLFPLKTVAFPQGLLPLKVFNSTYLKLVRECIADDISFGIVAMVPSANVAKDSGFPFASVGTSLTVLPQDMQSRNVAMMQCIGQKRFKVRQATQRTDGLWIGQVEDIRPDFSIPIPHDLKMTRLGLRSIVESMTDELPKNELPFVQPYEFNDCNWVANRWCELLNLTLAQ